MVTGRPDEQREIGSAMEQPQGRLQHNKEEEGDEDERSIENEPLQGGGYLVHAVIIISR